MTDVTLFMTTSKFEHREVRHAEIQYGSFDDLSATRMHRSVPIPAPLFISIHLHRPLSTPSDHHPRPKSHPHHHQSIRTHHPSAFANPLLHQHALACRRYFHCHLLRYTISHTHHRKVAWFAQLFHLLHYHLTPLPPPPAVYANKSPPPLSPTYKPHHPYTSTNLHLHLHLRNIFTGRYRHLLRLGPLHRQYMFTGRHLHFLWLGPLHCLYKFTSSHLLPLHHMNINLLHHHQPSTGTSIHHHDRHITSIILHRTMIAPISFLR